MPEWDPQDKEDCKRIVRQALGREPEAGELIMLTIRLHTEPPEAVPRIRDAVLLLQKSAEYRYCTAAWESTVSSEHRGPRLHVG